MAAKPDKDILLLIDSHALIHRAFHAFPQELTTKDGEVVNAVYGFAKLLLEVLLKFNPAHVVAAFDAPGGTVRHDKYGAYKANRAAPDDLLVAQIPRIEHLLAAFDIPMLRVPGFEADDIIGTLDLRHSGEGKHTIIVTGDRDLFQLVDEDTSVYMAGSAFSQSKIYDAKAVKERMGVAPEQIVDLKSLQGDASDNIPGVAGIGEKGAVALLTEFGTLDDIYKNIEKAPPRYQQKLILGQEMAYTSQDLATILKDIPVSFDFEKAMFGTFDPGELEQFMHKLEFRSLISQIHRLCEKYSLSPDPKAAPPAQFGELEILPWDGKPVAAEEIFIIATGSATGDPLQWELTKCQMLANNLAWEVDLKKLANFLQMHPGQWLVCSDAKFLLHGCLNHEIVTHNKFMDLGIVARLLTNGELKSDWPAIRESQGLVGGVSQELQLMQKLYTEYKQQLGLDDTQKKLVEMETSLVPVVVQMERAGVVLDAQLAKQYEQALQAALLQIQLAIHERVGHEFNIDSPKQVGEVLFGELGLPAGKKTKTGNYSTDERTLLELRTVDPIVETILRYRELNKLLNTYVKPLPTLINPVTGRIHATFNQMGALTGRFSSTNPNLQNIPTGESLEVNMRKAFKAAPGNVLVSFDYSQQELRLLAQFSAEEHMQTAFRSGVDIHAATAAEIFEVPVEEVTKEQRKVGKTINFGVVYGISAFGLADRLKIDNKKAAGFIKSYFENYPKVKVYYDNLIVQARETGFVETILRRRRNCLDLRSTNYTLRSAVEREVMNFPLQGSAADIIKLAMVEVSKLGEKYPARLIMQVHDELVFEYQADSDKIHSDKQLTKFIDEVKHAMLSVVSLDVPFEVGVEVGVNWSEGKDWDK